jgi:hypothetical protein
MLYNVNCGLFTETVYSTLYTVLCICSVYWVLPPQEAFEYAAVL